MDIYMDIDVRATQEAKADQRPKQRRELRSLLLSASLKVIKQATFLINEQV